MHSNAQTILVIGSIIYTLILLKSTVRQKIELYDFVHLCSLVLLPSIFVIFPEAGIKLTNLIGVVFPFVILFSILFVELFFLQHRNAIKIHKLEKVNRRLVQTIAILESRDKD